MKNRRIRQSETCIKLPGETNLSFREEREAIMYLEQWKHGLWKFEWGLEHGKTVLRKVGLTYLSFMSIPTWVLARKRCQFIYPDLGQCSQGVYTKHELCHYHQNCFQAEDVFGKRKFQAANIW